MPSTTFGASPETVSASNEANAGADPTTQTQTDQSLIERVIGGDPQAFEALMHRHNQKLYRATRSILHSDADAEEAVQEAWWKAYTHLRDYRGNAQPATWLTRIAVNEALMHRRRNKSRNAVIQSPENTATDADQDTFMPQAKAPSSTQPGAMAERAELRQLIEQKIDALPEIYRTVFMLRGVDAMTARDTALALGISTVTVRVRYMRARRMLRTALKKDIDPAKIGAFSFAGERCDRIVAGVQARIRAAAES